MDRVAKLVAEGGGRILSFKGESWDGAGAAQPGDNHIVHGKEGQTKKKNGRWEINDD